MRRTAADSSDKAPTNSAGLYESDFHAWAFEQARRLRAGEAIDAGHVAEELESLGKSEEQQLVNRLTILIAHKLKWDFQLSQRSNSWRATIREQQKRIRRHLEKHPSLKPLLADTISEAHDIAVTFASVDTNIIEEDFPAECLYTFEELIADVE